jgi:hypothetical protein
MTITRLDHVSVVDGLAAAIAFFTVLGMSIEGVMFTVESVDCLPPHPQRERVHYSDHPGQLPVRTAGRDGVTC